MSRGSKLIKTWKLFLLSSSYKILFNVFIEMLKAKLLYKMKLKKFLENKIFTKNFNPILKNSLNEILFYQIILTYKEWRSLPPT